MLSAGENASLPSGHYDECVDSARELVLAHLRFVVYIVRSYSGYGLAEADLIQEGNAGLMKAVKRFDPNRGCDWCHLPCTGSKQKCTSTFAKRRSKVATTKAQRKLFTLRVEKSLGWLSAEETRVIAADLGVDESEVTRMESRLSGRDIAFDAPADSDDEESWQAPQYFLMDGQMDPGQLVEDEDFAEDSAAKLQMALADLDDRSRDILERRWLLDEKSTLHELADEYQVSAERIRQLEVNALKKMRAAMIA